MKVMFTHLGIARLEHERQIVVETRVYIRTLESEPDRIAEEDRAGRFVYLPPDLTAEPLASEVSHPIPMIDAWRSILSVEMYTRYGYIFEKSRYVPSDYADLSTDEIKDEIRFLFAPIKKLHEETYYDMGDKFSEADVSKVEREIAAFLSSRKK